MAKSFKTVRLKNTLAWLLATGVLFSSQLAGAPLVPTGVEFTLAESSSHFTRPKTPLAAHLGGNGGVVIWRVREPHPGMVAQLLDSNHHPLDVPFVFRPSEDEEGDTLRGLFPTPTGEFIVLWDTYFHEDYYDDNGDRLPQPIDVFYRRLDAAGQPLGPEVEVSEDRETRSDFVSGTISGKGDFLVVWDAVGKIETPPYAVHRIKGRAFDDEGEAYGPAFEAVNQGEELISKPRVAYLGEDKFVVIWTAAEITYGQLIDRDGGRHSDVFFVTDGGACQQL